MSKTNLSIDGAKFKINGQLTYSEIESCKPSVHGLLMNARFIQGIFDSKNREQFQGIVPRVEQGRTKGLHRLPFE